MKNVFKIMFMIIFLIINIQNSFAQTAERDFIDLMREGGKIYVVYLLLGVIVTGILIYLVLLERKIAKLEKKVK